MDEATEGVVYVSFGSVLQGALVPKDKQEALLNGIFYAGKNISYLYWQLLILLRWQILPFTLAN